MPNLCEGCRHFSLGVPHLPIKFVDFYPEHGGKDGECRLNPPQVVAIPPAKSDDYNDSVYIASLFPLVYLDDWCGRWEA